MNLVFIETINRLLTSLIAQLLSGELQAFKFLKV